MRRGGREAATEAHGFGAGQQPGLAPGVQQPNTRIQPHILTVLATAALLQTAHTPAPRSKQRTPEQRLRPTPPCAPDAGIVAVHHQGALALHVPPVAHLALAAAQVLGGLWGAVERNRRRVGECAWQGGLAGERLRMPGQRRTGGD